MHRVSSARSAVRDDVDSRARRYLVSMGIRTVSFVLAVIADGWLRWVLVALAIVLPYLSVVFANGGRERAVDLPDQQLDVQRRSIEGGDQ